MIGLKTTLTIVSKGVLLALKEVHMGVPQRSVLRAFNAAAGVICALY
jgi:hypothetical protein